MDDRPIAPSARSALRRAESEAGRAISAGFLRRIAGAEERAACSAMGRLKTLVDAGTAASRAGSLMARAEAEARLLPDRGRGLREMGRRVPGFRLGFSVELCDGARWHFPRLTSAAPGHMERLKALDAARKAGDPVAIIRAEMRLYAFLLGLNYHLSADDLAEVLRIDYGAGADPKFARMRGALLAVAVGDDPDRTHEPDPATDAPTHPEEPADDDRR